MPSPTSVGHTARVSWTEEPWRRCQPLPPPLSTGFVSTGSTTLASPSSSSSALHVWWFGGTEQSEVNGNSDSCELVAVRIERTSHNSRKIAGEITIPVPLDDVWAILTDYDRLATHVPNLVESRILQRNSPGEAGDGSFRCRLFQKGAQKIVGFEFGASVTMDMTEQVTRIANGQPNADEKKIIFKCVESQFFNEFDGEWKVKERIGPDGQLETVCSYVVDVRPKGPVPVAALEWRIREDVPTNLRAVKAAALSVGRAGVNAARKPRLSTAAKYAVPSANGANGTQRNGTQQRVGRMLPVMMDWDRDETMGKYL